MPGPALPDPFRSIRVDWRRVLPLSLSLLGFVLCFLLPPHGRVFDMIAHVSAAALVVIALGIDLAAKSKDIHGD